MRTKVVGLGAGGHAKVVLEVLLADATIEMVGLLDRDSGAGQREVFGVPVLGSDDLLPVLRRDGVEAFVIGIGSVGQSTLRRELFEKAIQYGLRPLAVIHERVFVSPSAVLGRGPTVLAGAIIGTGARLGDNVLVNTGAILDHEVIIGSHVHVATGARLAGGVVVEDGALIGLGAMIRQGQRIGAGAIVGAGAVVVDDVPAGVTVAGVPARLLQRSSVS